MGSFYKKTGIKNLFHSTYIDNLHSILHKGKLLSNTERNKYKYKFKGTQGGTDRKLCDPNTITKKDYSNCDEAPGCYFLILKSDGDSGIPRDSYEAIFIFDSKVCNTEQCYLNSKDNFGFYFDETESHWSGARGETYKFDNNRIPDDKLFSNNIRKGAELIVPNSVDLKFLKKIIISDDYELNLPQSLLNRYGKLIKRVTPKKRNYKSLDKLSPHHNIDIKDLTKKQIVAEYNFFTGSKIQLYLLTNIKMKQGFLNTIKKYRVKHNIRINKKKLGKPLSKKNILKKKKIKLSKRKRLEYLNLNMR